MLRAEPPPYVPQSYHRLSPQQFMPSSRQMMNSLANRAGPMSDFAPQRRRFDDRPFGHELTFDKDKEFDFEKNNEQLEKMMHRTKDADDQGPDESSKVADKAEEAQNEYYDPKASFFDKISTDSRKDEQRPAPARVINSQTFGEKAVYEMRRAYFDRLQRRAARTTNVQAHLNSLTNNMRIAQERMAMGESVHGFGFGDFEHGRAPRTFYSNSCGVYSNPSDINSLNHPNPHRVSFSRKL